MAKIRIVNPGEFPNKQKFKRNNKIKKYTNRLLILGLLLYVSHKEHLIDYLIKFLQ